MNVDRDIAVVSLAFGVWAFFWGEQVRDKVKDKFRSRSLSKMQARLDEINDPQDMVKQRNLRDSSALSGLLFTVCGFFFHDVRGLESPNDKFGTGILLIFELASLMVALTVSLSAVLHHFNTDPETLEIERSKLMKKL